MCAAPARRGGRCPFNRRRVVPRRSRESGGEWGAVPRPGARGGWSPRWSRRLWRRESVSVREGRGSDRNRNRGHEAGPFSAGRGTGRPLLTPRPRPKMGGAPSGSLRSWGEGRPHQLRCPPIRSLSGDLRGGGSCVRVCAQTLGTERSVSSPLRPRLLNRGVDPQVIFGGAGRKQASAGLHLDPGARDPAPLGPQTLHSGPACRDPLLSPA